MPKTIPFRALPTHSGPWRLFGAGYYEGPRKAPGSQVRIECTECGDTSRVISVGIWNSVCKGNHKLACWACRPANAAGRKRNGLTITHDGVTRSILEWANFLGKSSGTIYDRHKKDKALPPEQQKGSAYILFGTDTYHPLRDAKYKPHRSVEKIIDTLEQEMIEELQSHLVTIAHRVAQARLKPLIYTLVSTGALQGQEQGASLPGTPPEGVVYARCPEQRAQGHTHDPNLSHPHDDDRVALNMTLLEYRQWMGDATAITPIEGRWDYLEEYRLGMEDGDEFSRSEYNRMLNEPVWPDDVKRIREEQEAEDAAKKAAEEAEKAAKIKAKRDAEEAEAEKWRIHCLERDMPFARISERHWYTLPERCRIPGGRLPIAQGHDHQEPRDGSFLTRQGDAPPALTDQHVREHYLSTPWWKSRTMFPFLEYGFEFVCRTQYERIVAFYRWTPRKGTRQSGRLLCDPTATWLRTHVDLNLYMDLEALLEWPTNRKQLEESLYPRVKAAYVEGIEHPSSEIQQLARELSSKFPQLGLQPEDSL